MNAHVCYYCHALTSMGPCSLTSEGGKKVTYPACCLPCSQKVDAAPLPELDGDPCAMCGAAGADLIHPSFPLCTACIRKGLAVIFKKT